MYYEKFEIDSALERATEVMNQRSKTLLGHKWGYTDCWSFVMQYDKAIRNGDSPLLSLELKYKDHQEFQKELRKIGYNNLSTFSNKYNYEQVKSKRPQHGDIAYGLTDFGFGSALIAQGDYWITVDGLKGVVKARLIRFYERSLLLIARPLRS